jgi:hypothetical protein
MAAFLMRTSFNMLSINYLKKANEIKQWTNGKKCPEKPIKDKPQQKKNN